MVESTEIINTIEHGYYTPVSLSILIAGLFTTNFEGVFQNKSYK